MGKEYLPFKIFSVALLTHMSNKCVIKDYYQITIYKKRVFLFIYSPSTSTRHICIYSGYLLTPSGTFLLRIFLLSQSSLPDILSYLVQLIDINTIQEIGMLEK